MCLQMGNFKEFVGKLLLIRAWMVPSVQYKLFRFSKENMVQRTPFTKKVEVS